MTSAFLRILFLTLMVVFLPVSAFALPSGGDNANTQLKTVYPNVPSASPTCRGCHVDASVDTTQRNAFGLALRPKITANPGYSDAQLRAFIREVGEDSGFEPKATAFGVTGNPTTLRISASRTADIPITISNGKTAAGGSTTIDNASLSPTTPLVSVQSDGDLAIGTLSEGSSASFKIILENAAGYRNTSSSPATLTLRVNNVPVFGSAPAQAETDDNETGRYETTPLLSRFSDGDSDPLTGVAGSVTVQEIRTETNALDPGSYALSPDISSTGVLSFLPTGFDALNAGESRTVTFAFQVTDGYDTATGTVQVKVNGVPETGTNVQPLISARTLSVSAASLPQTTDLTTDDSGNPFVDPDNDVLSINAISPDLSGMPQFTLTGDLFGVQAAAVFTRLGAGQTATQTFNYDILQTRPGSGGAETYLVNNTLAVTVTGVNDPVTASDFTATIEEGISPIFLNLENKTLWSDPDVGDVLRGSNLNVVSQSKPLLSDGAMSISSDGKFLELTPAFVDDLAKNDVATVVVTLDVIDGNGSSKAVTGTLSIVGQAVSHTTQAGLYANSLAELYPFADFQQASSQPAACFTCHTTQTNLLAAKPNCNSAKDFSPFGQELCSDDRGGPIGARLERREAKYAPRFVEQDIIRYLSTSDAPGYTDDTPILHTTGLTVDGDVSSIHSFYIRDDFGGSFDITPSGRIRLLKPVPEGRYELEAYPINISGSKTATGEVRKVAGFYPRASGLTKITIEVSKGTPIAVDDRYNVEAGKSTTLDVLANDRGNLQVNIAATQPSHGAVTVRGREIVYTPDPGFSGADSFSYTSNSTDPIASSTATVTLTVVSPGGVLAQDDVATIAPGQTVTIDVLGNDTNAKRGTIVAIATAPQAALGTARVVGQQIEFTASETLTSDVVIVYRASNPNTPGVNGSSAFLRLRLARFGGGVLSAAVDAPALKEVADVLDRSCLIASSLADNDARRAFLRHCGDIVGAAEAGQDLTQILRAVQNEEHFASVDAIRQISRGIGRTVQQRLSRVRGGGGRGFDGSGLSLIADGETVPLDVLTLVARAALGLSLDGYGVPSASQMSTVWGGFVAGQISLTERDDKPGRSGYDIVATNVVAGIDYDKGDGRVVGAGLGYSQSETDFADGGSMTGRGLQVIFYGSQDDFLTEGLTLDGFVSFGKVRLSSERVIRFTTPTSSVDTVAYADFEARFLNIAPQLSYRQLVDQTGAAPSDIRHGLSLTWFGRLDYLKMWVDGYTETGGDGLALRTQASEFESLLVSVGLEASRPIHLIDNVRSTAYVSLSVNGELLDETRSVTSAFDAAGPLAPTFVVTEEGSKGLGGTLEIGTEFTFANGDRTDIAISHEVAADDARTTTLSLSYRTNLGGPGLFSLGLDASDQSGADGRSWKAKAEYAMEF